MLRLIFLVLSSGSNLEREYTRRQPMETCFLGADLRIADTRPPSTSCEMFFDAQSLGRACTTAIQEWCGTGTLLVLIARMNPSFPRMVTIAWSTGQEAVITDVDLQAPCTLQGPGRPRWLGSHEGS